MTGAPYVCSNNTSLPLGPRVAATALDTFSTPLTKDFLDSSPNCNCLAILLPLIFIVVFLYL